MKIFTVSVSMLVLVLVQLQEARTWGASDIAGAWNEGTDQIKEFIKNRTQAVGNQLHNYVEKVNEIRTDMAGFIEDKRKSLSYKFDEYVDTAQRSGKKIVKTVTWSSKDCPEFNPEVTLTTPALIARHGYAAESHTIKTEDGYLLTLHRIPRGKASPSGFVPRKTVLLHHGLLGSSADWVMSGPGKSLAYILADAGYDVWMGNARGNTYSRAHVSLATDSFAFWNFTWHEIGTRDLPAVIDYINALKDIDHKIHYVGHSMGTTILFVLLSSLPEYNQRLHAGYALAPVAYMSDIKSPIKLLAPIANDIEAVIKLFGANEFLPQNYVLRWLSRYMCEINHYEEAICENSMFVLCGHDEQQFNKTLLPVILGHVPAGASTKTLVHYAQLIQEKTKFQQYDYGSDGNLHHYGTEKPPEYPLDKITLPMSLLSAQNDWLSGVKDVENLYKKLNNPVEHYIVPLEVFNHIDFLWAKDAPKLVYDKLQELMVKKEGDLIFQLDFKFK